MSRSPVFPTRSVARCAAALACWGWASQAAAKVAFTGYADFRSTPESTISYQIPKSLAAGLGGPTGRLESRTMAFDSIGLFATTSLAEQTDFLLDVSYRDIGYTTRTLRLQYAYLEHRPAENTMLRAGKIMLPFGYLNQNRYYSFQQSSITAPSFLSSIMGLPIADLGASVRQTLPLGPVAIRAVAYGVNGYGPVPGSRTSFRSPSLPGGISFVNNLGSTDANKKPAGGGRLALQRADGAPGEFGGSYYAGDWDAAGKRLLQMANGHAVLETMGVTAIAEYTHLDVEDDAGMKAVFRSGSGNWRTDGYVAILEYRGLEAAGKPLVPWARAEDYRSRGASKTATNETLRGYAGGLAWNALAGVTLKAEYNQLSYRVPYIVGDSLAITAASWMLGLSVSF